MPKNATSSKINRKWTRYAGYLLLFAAVQFILAMMLAQYAFPCTGTGCYNILTNPISDLGNTFSSPLWFVFNYSLAIFGAVSLGALMVLKEHLPDNSLRGIGLFIIMMGILGAIGVGVVPENTILFIHSVFALIAFVGLALGILLLGFSMRRDRNWASFGTCSIVLGALSLICIGIFLLPSFGLLPRWIYFGPGVGFGAIERLVMLPSLVWVLLVGWKFSFWRSN